MTTYRKLIILASLVAFGASAAHAQFLQQGTTEINVNASLSQSTQSGSDPFGFATGSLGYFLTDNWHVNAGATAFYSDGDTDLFVFGGIKYFWPGEIWSPYVGASYFAHTDDFGDGFAQVGVGLYQAVSERTAITYGLEYGFPIESGSDGIIRATLGISIFFN